MDNTQRIVEMIQKAKEKADTKAFLDSIIENIPNMIFVKEASELRFIRFNSAGENLLGYSKHDLIGKNDYDFFPKSQADFFIAKDRDVLKNRQILDIPEEPIQTKYGTRFLHTKKVPLYDENGNPQYLLGISEDITEKKQTQQALLKTVEQLARSKTELEQLELFAFAASHDLQEPLRSIVYYSDYIRTQLPTNLNPDVLSSLERIEKASMRMRVMMEQMRELSRVQTAGSVFESVDLNIIVDDVVSHLEHMIKDTKAKVSKSKLPTISGDKTQLYQLFQNIIVNAIKFQSPGNAPQVHISSKSLDHEMVEITIKDNGIGFDEKYLDRIFKPFQRLNKSTDYSGTGIGLAISQKIAKRHGGDIIAHSTPGKGSTFVVYLSLKMQPESP